MKKRLFAIMLCVALTSGCVYAESAVSTESTESTESNSDADSTESAVDIDSTVRTESVESEHAGRKRGRPGDNRHHFCHGY